ncbi:MAG: hypothetical protein GY869_16410 [Planctomycetes bacterium]|nr:hypothetical protein [Planctomycetota bacterium]
MTWLNLQTDQEFLGQCNATDNPQEISWILQIRTELANYQGIKPEALWADQKIPDKFQSQESLDILEFTLNLEKILDSPLNADYFRHLLDSEYQNITVAQYINHILKIIKKNQNLSPEKSL